MERIIDETQLETFRGDLSYVLDVRTPDEFAEDHFPGALNIPVLTNEQREEVGTLYKTNAFEARKLGATYTTLAIHEFLKTDLACDLKKGQRLMVYCARGGQRSGSLGVVLSEIGFLVYRLKKGYKSYRRYVLDIIARPLPGPVYVLFGYTGSGKTRILQALKDDCNVLDLEGLANHRGSLLGHHPGQTQPSQRAFETELMETLRRFDPSKPTLIEGESRKVGHLNIPNTLWQQMKGGKHLWLDIPRKERVSYILEDYQDLKDVSHLEGPLERLKRYIPTEVYGQMQEDMAARNWAPLVENLLEYHYDPLYARPLKLGNRYPLSARTTDEGVVAMRELLKKGM